ncbi:hypothetical protein K2173_011904 [Erythroxylum novogranatense]|uniref:Uncharacterized protein n=1 Tax=Erythroxylum novogranatense TaxID=1862640 RepID=A0AAV8TGS3_9ROSI|nr:hypothetical protein K2173_011904 [Erythroxylum novogranatense]
MLSSPSEPHPQLINRMLGFEFSIVLHDLVKSLTSLPEIEGGRYTTCMHGTLKFKSKAYFHHKSTSFVFKIRIT